MNDVRAKHVPAGACQVCRELGGYETWRARSSHLEVDAAPKIVETVMELFTKLQ